jgi:hypothetical protein
MRIVSSSSLGAPHSRAVSSASYSDWREPNLMDDDLHSFRSCS